MLTALMLLNGCASGEKSGTRTTEAVCDVLRGVEPSYSSRDTPETLEAGKRFLVVFGEVCGSVQ